MAVEIIDGRYEPGEGSLGKSCFYCNTTGIAFGPVFDFDEDPQDFENWLRNAQNIDIDLRILNNTIIHNSDGDSISALNAYVIGWREFLEVQREEAEREESEL